MKNKRCPFCGEKLTEFEFNTTPCRYCVSSIVQDNYYEKYTKNSN